MKTNMLFIILLLGLTQLSAQKQDSLPATRVISANRANNSNAPILQTAGEKVAKIETTVNAIEAKIKEVSGLVNSLKQYQGTLGDLTPDLQLKVQDAQQKIQQAVQMLSALMKDYEETAKAIIKNIRE